MLTFGQRIAFAFRAFFALLFKGRIQNDILDAFRPARDDGATARVPSAATAADPAAPEMFDAGHARAVQILALLQRDGRLLDFLHEDIASYSDAQVGAAVRDLHARCREVVQRYVPLEPVLVEDEGQTAVIRAETSPALVKMVGNMTGAPPYRGVVRHRGWRVTRVALPPLAAADVRDVAAPAEVEVA